MKKNSRGKTNPLDLMLKLFPVLRVGENGELQPADKTKPLSNIIKGGWSLAKKVSQKALHPPMETCLTKIYIEPTTMCNLQCRTCMRNSWDEPTGSMDMNVFQMLLYDSKEFKTLDTMAFWGIGEPLMHPEIVRMVALAHDMGLKTELITNGLLLDRDMAKGLIDAGLDTLVVSVDGTTQASYSDIRTGGNLLQVEENVSNLMRLREESSRKNPEIGLEFVVMKSNLDQLPDLAEKARSMDAKFILVSNLLPCTEDMQEEILYWISATIDSREESARWSPDLILPRMDLRLKTLPPVQALVERLGKPMPAIMDIPQEDYCPFVQKGSLSVAWNGDVSPCIALMHSYRCYIAALMAALAPPVTCIALMHSYRCYILGREKLIKRYSVGNVFRQSLIDIWNKRDYREFRDRVFAFDFSPCVSCSGCDLSDTNEQDCIGNTHPVCGDCLWAKGVLLCP